jgi:hypothetical protein
MQTIKDLTIDEFRAVIGEVVEEKLREFFSDPDVGLALRPEVETRLKQQLENPQVNGRALRAADVATRLGLEVAGHRREIYR